MDWQQKIAKFPMIRKAAEEALEEFIDSGIEDIYTPGSLRVVDVEWCLNEDGDSRWIITIEEAAPQAYKLSGFIANRLADKQIVAHEEVMKTREDLAEKIRFVLNCASREGCSDTPDFILAEYMLSALECFETACRDREKWYGRQVKDINGEL